MVRARPSEVCRRLLPLIVSAALLTGCAVEEEHDVISSGSGLSSAGRGATALESAMAADNGLELRRWVVRDDPDHASFAIGATGREAIDDASLRERLERNGFRLRLLDQDRVNEALRAFGDPFTDVSTWHGQATQWRELARRPIGPGLATVVDGRARAFTSGALRLLTRAWTLPMEDGLRLSVELLPHFDPLGHGGYRALLGSDSIRGERFEALAVELHLRPGEALLVTAESPMHRLHGDESEGADESDRGPVDGVDKADAYAESAVAAAPSPRLPARSVDFGPPAATPTTLGELLLCGDVPPMRTVLVLLPRLPEMPSNRNAPAGAGPHARESSR